MFNALFASRQTTGRLPDKQCTEVDISYFNILQHSSTGGYIPFHSSKDLFAHKASFSSSNRIQYLREYLPTTTNGEKGNANKSNASATVRTSGAFLDVSTAGQHAVGSRSCDETFSRSLDHWISHNVAISEHPGSPHPDLHCRCGVGASIGKYLRYNSIFEFRHFTGLPNQTLYDIKPTGSWRWASSLCAKAGKEYEGSWNCAFLPLSYLRQSNNTAFVEQVEFSSIIAKKLARSTSSINNNKPNTTTTAASTTKEKKQQLQQARRRTPAINSLHPSINFDRILSHRSNVTYKDSLVQMLLYGKMLWLLARPGAVVQRFINDNIAVLNRGRGGSGGAAAGSPSEDQQQHSLKQQPTTGTTIASGTISTDTASTAKGGGSSNNKFFTSSGTDGTYKNNNDGYADHVVSVSMHVRHGDSCDFILNDSVAYMTHYLQPRIVKIGRVQPKKRPCFSVHVYMEKLYQLQQLYNVRRVYLATDSSEMIQRTYNEKEFEWVFTNISRSYYDDRSKGWIDVRNSDDDVSFIMFSSVADLYLLSLGDIFLGGFTSHFSKLAYYLMLGRSMRLLPFISVDYPLSCDTIDACDDVDVTNRFEDVEQMVTDASECRAVK